MIVRMRTALLIALSAASGAGAQEHKPMRPATAAERAERVAVVHADYRYDDLLWENDKTAHRIYGRALEAAEPPSSSGIDAWGKRVPYPYMDRQLRTGDQHSDHGEGVDFYNVGTGRGVGGLGVWWDNKLWTSRNYVRYRVLRGSGDRADFTVDYARWPVGVERWVEETRRFTLPAGTHFTRMISTLRSRSTNPLIVGIGISKRPIAGAGLGTIVKDKERARLVWWGPTDPQKGSMAGAVAVNPAAFAGFAEDSDNYLILVRVTPGRPFVYYAGASWDRGSDYKSAAAWQAHVVGARFDFRVPAIP
jgi:hypothetical protein